MKEKKIAGVMAPPIVPFTEDGEVDEIKLREYMIWLVEKGCHCLYVLGTFGSGALLSVEERKRCAEVIMDAVGSRVPVICHIGAQHTKASLELAKHAERMGMDAIASVPPTYYKHVPETIKAYFKELLDSVGIPLFVYNFPGSVGYGLSPELVAELAEMGVAGIKDSSFDLIFFMRLMNSVKKPDFIWVNGVPALMLPAVLLGASAVTSGTANACPEFTVSLWDAIQEKEFDKAAELQKNLVRLADLQGMTIPIVGVHEILRFRGFDFGYPRAPLKPFTGAQRERLKQGLIELGIL
ncbi:MAG: dihydrodipicolinate synthase family protein [Deltaproteobacteria bacterium]|nr:dihydrodipicolinate synthase family protein [Deltaproteobacteria bacterium]MBW2153876.1 dihydrodipicolinate synthase family protein [Deltaproteobacteria bacterium]